MVSLLLISIFIVFTVVIEARVIDGSAAMDLLAGDSELKQSQSKQFANIIPRLLFHHFTEKDTAIDWLNVPESVQAEDYSETDFSRMHSMLNEMIISQLGIRAVDEPAIFCGDPLYPHRIEHIAFTPRILRIHYKTNECRNLVLKMMRRMIAEKREECRHYSCVKQNCPPTIKWCDSPILGLLPVLPDQVPALLTMTDQKNENRKQQREFVLRHKLAERTKKRTRYGLNSIKKMLIGGGKLAEKFSNEFQIINPANYEQPLSVEQFRAVAACKHSRLLKTVIADYDTFGELCETALSKMGLNNIFWREKLGGEKLKGNAAAAKNQ
ncbi:hypothetical protein niasHT_000588 [Heterodera trifolii]|uniref:Uncharacterized protein n=1 Tax=Heterodera trifolii TaxID=157864 RepID=A0ABD2LYY3_9BILA